MDIFAGDGFIVDVPLNRPLQDLLEGEGVATGVGIKEVFKEDEVSELSKMTVFKVGEDVLNVNYHQS